MVIKALLSLILFASFCSDAHADVYAQAMAAFKKKQHVKSVNILKKSYTVKKFSSQTPTKVYRLMADNLVSLRKYNLAVRYYRTAIKRGYRETDVKMRSQFFADGEVEDADELPKELLELYYRVLYSAVKYMETLVKLGHDVKFNMQQCVDLFGGILEEAEYKEDNLEKLVDKYEKLLVEVERRKYERDWYVFLGYVSWQDQIDFIDTDGSTYEINAPAEGTAIGVGWQKTNYYWGYKFEFTYASLSANAGFSSSTVNYFQKGVAVSLLNFESGVFFKPFTREVAIGINIPIFYKSGEYQAVPGTSIEGDTRISTGLVIEGQWTVGEDYDWSLSSRIGKIFGLSSGFWGVYVGYHF